MRLAVSIGNTTCRIAWMAGEDAHDTRVQRSLVFDHAQLRSGHAARKLQEETTEGAFEGVSSAGLCSVVPPLQSVVLSLLEDAGAPAPRIVRPQSASWFPTRYRTMETLGADRFCAVLAAREMAGAPVVVIDCGTATTVNVVDRDGYFRGGSIAPGLDTAFAALHEHTAQLPAVEAKAGEILGDDSASSIRSGVVQFTRLALEGMLRELIAITGPDVPVFLTGGKAPVLLGAGLSLPRCTHDADLLFRGVILFLHFTE